MTGDDKGGKMPARSARSAKSKAEVAPPPSPLPLPQPLPGLPIAPDDLKPSYANAAQINSTEYEFTLTFLRAEVLFPPGPDGRTPALIAARVALSHRAMKEFLDAAIDNYQSHREKFPETPLLKIQA
jgi:hypothetical protein